MKKSNKFILPLGSSFVGLIIISLFFYSLFLVTGLYIIVNGLSVNLALVVTGSLIILISAIFIILLDIWSLFLLRVEFEGNILVLHYFTIPAKIIKKTKTEVSLLNLSKITRLKGNLLLIMYENGKAKEVQLKSFSKKQVSKIILEITSRAQSINENKIVVEIK